MVVGAVVLVGMFLVILLGASQKLGHSGKLGVVFGVLALPMMISLLVKGWLLFSWWIIPLFIVISLLVSPITIAARRGEQGGAGLVAMQPLIGAVGLAASIGCWLLKG